MTENQKMRALLDEARDAVKRSMGAWTWAGYPDSTTDEKALLERIDAALAEPVKARDYTFRGGYVEDAAGDRWWSSELLARVERERDEARAEVKWLRQEVKSAANVAAGEAFARGVLYGAQEMRAAAVKACRSVYVFADDIRSIPLPKEVP